MSYLLSGSERKRLRELVLAAFDRASLVMALREAEPSRDFEQLVPQAGFARQVGALIDRAETEGWLQELQTIFQVERAGRQDLIDNLSTILESAKQRAEQFGGSGESPATAMRARMLRFTIAVIVITSVCIAVWFVARALAPEIGIWAVPGMVMASGAALILGFCTALGPGARTFWLSRLPLVVLVLSLLGVIANALVLVWAARESRQANFFATFVEDSVPLVNQRVELQRAQSREAPKVENTNANGEAFFNLAVGSQHVYLGRIEIREDGAFRRCQIPAFPIEQTRSIRHDIANLNSCSPDVQPRTGAPDFSLRVSTLHTRGTPIPISISATAAQLSTRRSRSPLGLPKAPVQLDARFYTAGYDPAIRGPRWVAFTVDTRNTRQLPRERMSFSHDPQLPEEVQSDPSDYMNNPYDRGTLIRRTDALIGRSEAEARASEREIFYYSVVVPQPAETNRITWLAVEEYATRLSAEVGPIHVIAGPVYPLKTPDSMPYLVIGPGRTPVPIQLFRVLLRKKPGGDWAALGFLVPNDGSRSRDASSFIVPIKRIEAATGLQFFPQLEPSVAARLKARVDPDFGR